METSAVIATVRSCTEPQLKDLEAATGVPLSTLAKIRYGVTLDPRASTIDKLRAHFAAHGVPGAAPAAPASVADQAV